MSDGRITVGAEHGVHIELTCRNHPLKRWSTKNISPIGCRTIFFDLMRNMPDPDKRECDCPLGDLLATGNETH